MTEGRKPYGLMSVIGVIILSLFISHLASLWSATAVRGLMAVVTFVITIFLMVEYTTVGWSRKSFTLAAICGSVSLSSIVGLGVLVPSAVTGASGSLLTEAAHQFLAVACPFLLAAIFTMLNSTNRKL